MEKIRFIVRGRHEESELADFLSDLHGDPMLELIEVIGPPGKPHTAVVAVPPEQAPSFEQRFGNSPHLLIERDRPLSLFDKDDGRAQRSERNTNG